jgi:quercetin dioxygenase-like cupin family protein
MQVFKSTEMKNGWFIGNFEPSVLWTPEFEVGVLKHSKGEIWKAHYHKAATEYNYLVSGEMTIQGRHLTSGDIFVLDRYEVADPDFLTDCTVVVVKTPSDPKDKYTVET